MSNQPEPTKSKRFYVKVDKTPLSRIYQMRLFGRDFIFGWMNINEAAEIGDLGADPNDILERTK